MRAAAGLSLSLLAAVLGAPVFAETLAIVGGTVHTVSGPSIENGTVVVTDGKIAAVGRDAAVPSGARRVDVTGLHVYPGMIAASTTLGLTEIGSVRGTRDIAETGNINPNARALIALNADSELIPVARANGILTAHSATSGGVLTGTSVIWNLDGWNWEDMSIQDDAGLRIQWPTMIVATSWRNQKTEEEQKKEREEKLKELTNAFEDAKAYLKARKAEGVHHDLDVRWEAMIPVLEGRMPVYVYADEYSQIEAVLKFAEEQELQKVVIVGGRDAWRLADKLAKAGVPVILEDANELPRRDWEPYDAAFTVAKKLHDAGVRFCFAIKDAANLRNLPYTAATAAAFGLPKEEALKGVTLYSAQILGVADRLGSIEVGKDANLFVSDGDPLEITTHVKRVFIQGVEIVPESRHTRLYERYRNRPRTDGEASKLSDAY